MEAAAEELDFEKAVFYRDQLSMLREVQARQAVYTVEGEADVISDCQPSRNELYQCVDGSRRTCTGWQ